MLAAKTSLAARVDALGEDSGTTMGIENRAKLEMRLKALEENQVLKFFVLNLGHVQRGPVPNGSKKS